MNEPLPGVVTTSFSSRSAAVALRTVTRATPNTVAAVLKDVEQRDVRA
ncbi:hypothetical protein [Streptomyces sp. NPDC057238]